MLRALKPFGILFRFSEVRVVRQLRFVIMRVRQCGVTSV